ncbi:MAG: hypothetical protein VCE75_12785 [Alphaproteobacteria bacterium]
MELPLIGYFHVCADILRASIQHLRWLAKLDDFAVIAPDSFARPRLEYCFRNFTVDISISDQIRVMRLTEIDNAMAQIATLPWFDSENIFLIGHSQEGAVVSSCDGPVKICGRIILNGYRSDLWGNGMGDDEALLTFDSGEDFWFQKYPSHCRAFVLSRSNGISIYEADSTSHDLVLENWPLVQRFLGENLC